MTGLFEPAVALGDEIHVAEPLWTVVDPLWLRTFPRVLEGESVGVVLERVWD